MSEYPATDDNSKQSGGGQASISQKAFGQRHPKNDMVREESALCISAASFVDFPLPMGLPPGRSLMNGSTHPHAGGSSAANMYYQPNKGYV